MKVSKFVNMLEENGVLVAHSSLYNVAIRVSGETADIVRNILTTGDIEGYEDSDLVQDMIKHGFLVENGSDEDATANYLINCADNVLGLTMIVTRQCNFRCPYCYEEHENKVMEKKTYDDTLKFIKDYMYARPQRRISISFFGGEPLLEIDNIVPFMRALREECADELAGGKIEIHGGATTNGYFLTPENLKALNEVGVDSFQITVDGLEKDHDKTRVLKSGGGTWRRIMDNLLAAKATDLNFEIRIRTNYSEGMLSSMGDYFKFLEENFADDPRFRVYFEAVKNLGVSGETNTDFLQNDLCENESESTANLLAMLNKYNLKHTLFNGTTSVGGMRCYAAKENNFTIDYNGDILKCTVQLDNPHNVVGNVADEEQRIVPEKFAKWASYIPSEKCRNCSVYPVCCGKKCPINYDKGGNCRIVRGLYTEMLRYTYLLGRKES